MIRNEYRRLITYSQLTSVEKRISSKNDLASAVFHEPTDRVLRMAWGVQCLDRNITNLEAFAVLWSLGDTLTILATNDRLAFEFRICQLFSEVRVLPEVELRSRLGLPICCSLLHDPSG